MRIDFLGRYKDVQQILTPPNQPSPKADGQSFPEFKIEDNIQLDQRASLSTDTHQPILPAPEMMARYNFSKPTLEEPLLEPLMEQAAVENPSESVKTPTIRSARRITAGSDFSELPIGKNFAQYKDLVVKYGGHHGVDPSLGLAVVSAESAFNPRAISSDGKSSKGLFQLLDSTGKEVQNRLEREGPYKPFDPEFNSDLGLGYLKHLHEVFSSNTVLKNNLETQAAANSTALEKLAVAAFNAGEGRVAHAQRAAFKDGKDPSRYEEVAPYLPEITQKYVQRVMQYKDEFRELNIG